MMTLMKTLKIKKGGTISSLLYQDPTDTGFVTGMQKRSEAARLHVVVAADRAG